MIRWYRTIECTEVDRNIFVKCVKPIIVSTARKKKCSVKDFFRKYDRSTGSEKLENVQNISKLFFEKGGIFRLQTDIK